jgi:uncharacterized OsmC-like protein
MKVSIELEEGNKLKASVRQHTLTFCQGDQEERKKSLFSGELLLISLGTCMMGTMLHFAENQDYNIRTACFHLNSEETTAPVRIANIVVNAQIEADLTQVQIDRLIRVASHCKIHNTLKKTAEVKFNLSIIKQ